jgi:hypothetical protein
VLNIVFPDPVTTAKDLFGRNPQLQELVAVMKEPSGARLVMRGERRIGKTSLLLVAKHEVREDNNVLVTLHTPYIQTTSYDAFLQIILGALSGVTRRTLYDFDFVSQPDERLTGIGLERIAEGLTRVLEGFPQKVTLCIDEVDETIFRCEGAGTSPGQASASGLEEARRMREFIEFLLSRPDLPLRVIITLTRRAALTEPVFSKVRQMNLEPFSLEETGRFIDFIRDSVRDIYSTLITIDSKAKELLYDLSGGHPYFLKFLLTKMHAHLSAPDKSHLRAEEILSDPHFLSDIAHDGQLDSTLENIYTVHFTWKRAHQEPQIFGHDPQKQVLLLVSRRAGGLTFDDLSVLNELIGAAEDAAARGWLNKDKEKGYTLRVGLIRHWLLAWTRHAEELKGQGVEQLERRLARRRNPWLNVTPTLASQHEQKSLGLSSGTE